MIARVWRTGLKPERAGAYETFARDVSLPMFRQQEGYLGCIMFRGETEAAVLTLWRDREAVAALDRSRSYKATVSRILQADLLTGPQSTWVSAVHLGDLEQMGEAASLSAGAPAGGARVGP